LLKKMGWKPGQGIGPRITKREKYLLLLKEGQVRVISEEALQVNTDMKKTQIFRRFSVHYASVLMGPINFLKFLSEIVFHK
jgi:hypothetical protein